MVKLAIFDVDYTLTKRETAFEFLMFMIKKNSKVIFHVPKSIVSALLYVLNIYSAGKAKEKFLGFINNIGEKEMESIVSEFYKKRLCRIFYEDAIKTIKKLKAQGYKIILISASGEFYLKELYNIKEIDKIIGTVFKIENGVYKNKIEGRNCKGQEKVNRLMKYIKDNKLNVDFKNSYMFSDSISDMPLFNLVGNAYLINSKKKCNNIKNLKWK